MINDCRKGIIPDYAKAIRAYYNHIKSEDDMDQAILKSKFYQDAEYEPLRAFDVFMRDKPDEF